MLLFAQQYKVPFYVKVSAELRETCRNAALPAKALYRAAVFAKSLRRTASALHNPEGSLRGSKAEVESRIMHVNGERCGGAAAKA
jgi:hypothetical protein